MMPIAPLMIEHRLIERMIRVMKKEIDLIGRDGQGEAGIHRRGSRFYQNLCRPLPPRQGGGHPLQAAFREEALRPLPASRGRAGGGARPGEDHDGQSGFREGTLPRRGRQSPDEIKGTMVQLVDFYPLHIEKEDRHFFIPCMEYFSSREQDVMLEAFYEFDRTLIHDKYRGVIAALRGEEIERPVTSFCPFTSGPFLVPRSPPRRRLSSGWTTLLESLGREESLEGLKGPAAMAYPVLLVRPISARDLPDSGSMKTGSKPKPFSPLLSVPMYPLRLP